MNSFIMRKKDIFFKKMDDLGLALTYADVRLRTSYAALMPDDVSLKTRFSLRVPLKIPLVSAAMDTVTDHSLAIEMAKLGGIGIIHRNFSPQEQAAEAAKVKYYRNGIVEKPICVRDSDRIDSILRKREEKGYSFHSFLVIDARGVLVGILTKNDFEFCDDLSKTAREVMAVNLVLAHARVPIDEAYAIMKKHKKKVLPIVDSRGEVAGMYTFKDLKRLVSGRVSEHNLDERNQLRVGAAIGVGADALARAALLVAEHVDVLVIDTAHGDSAPVMETLHELKSFFGDRVDVVAGNVSEGASAKRLIDAGADGIKVGQGPGSICTTRIIAGIGAPQVSAIYQCARVAEERDIPVCADGGIKYSGDIPIAIAAGASCVMLGSMLAGTKEAPGELVFFEGRQWKQYRGMGSVGAMTESIGSRERYNQRAVFQKSDLVPEGVEGLVPYKGDVRDVIVQYVGGLRRGMGYTGSKNIELLRTDADFVRLSPAGNIESHPHDVKITKESPNYYL